jgi:glutathione synthase/RimK-type ligase-like ATP-grasp enzyme
MHFVIFTKSSPKASANVRIANALELRGVKVSFCHPNRFALTMSDAQVLTYDGERFARPDFVLTRTGSRGHAPQILRHMKAAGFNVANSSNAIQIAVDKPRRSRSGHVC